MRTLCWIALLVLNLLLVNKSAAAETQLRIATFRADVTPPIGDGPCVGCMPKVSSIEHPLELRGVVLKTAGETYVIAAIDFCGICNTSDEFLRDALTRTAGTTRQHVALQSLHQHTAPILDADAVRLLHGQDSPQLTQHLQFTQEIATRGATAIDDSLKRLRNVTKIAATRAKVDRVAANRRVPLADGSIGVRASLTQSAEIRDASEGLIDPWLRTLSFFEGNHVLVQMHYYATHPQSSYGDSRVTWDTVGMAREQMEQATGVFQIYFTGCGGNVTLGKYNDGSRQCREEISSRLLDAMRRSAKAALDLSVTPDASSRLEEANSLGRADIVLDVQSLSAEEIDWKVAPLKFTPRDDGTFKPELLREQLAPHLPFTTRLTAAMFAGFGQRLRDGYIAQISRLRIGAIDILHLPGEPFVEFQLYAQDHARSGSFACVAGYGECGVWYYGPDRIYSDRGGYEQTWSLTGPCEKAVETTLVALLAP